MKKSLIAIIIAIIIVIIAGIYFFTRGSSDTAQPEIPAPVSTTTQSGGQVSTTQSNRQETIIGSSVQGNPITAYHYGTGTTTLLFVGGIHGGYSWNTVLVAEQLRSYLKTYPSVIPANVKVTVIPILNPDGLKRGIGTTTGDFNPRDVAPAPSDWIAGRFNGNNVDLNRNFDCNWQAKATWQSTPVSGGTAAFSEPESAALKAYIEANDPAAVVVWYSAAGGVYASSCENKGVSKETATLVETYAEASGYPAHASFDAYPTSGDMTNWLAKIGIPTISVLLTTHNDIEWSKNEAGIKALLRHYSNNQ